MTLLKKNPDGNPAFSISSGNQMQMDMVTLNIQCLVGTMQYALKT